MGVWQISWVQWGVLSLVLTHITIVSVTVYLHRSQAHRALDLHPVLTHFFRLWVWLATGMNTREWVAVHRKHHAFVETEQDPHSPKIYGIWMVLFYGVGLYRRAAASKGVLDKYGQGTPNDWLEKNVYSRKNLGVLLMLVIDVLLFGQKGWFLWGVQMLCIPLLAAGVINGIGHYLGYRNYEPVDQSRNIIPWGILIGGEELHNNHHAYPRSAKFSARWFEFDIGYVYIRLLVFLGLARVKYLLPNMDRYPLKGVKGILNARMSIYREFQTRVLKKVCRDRVKPYIQRLLVRPQALLANRERETLQTVLSVHERLAKIYQYQQSLYQVFYESKGNEFLRRVQIWCQDAKASGEDGLVEFANWLEERFLQVSYGS